MKTLSTKVPDDLAERIEEYEDDHGMNTSQALRQLVRDRLDAEDSQHTISLPLVLVWFGTVAFAAQYVTASGYLGPIGVVAGLIGLGLMNERINERVQALHARFTGREDASENETDADSTDG